MAMTRQKIVWGCLGITAVLAILCCIGFAVMVIIAVMTPWDTIVKNNMHDAEFRKGIEQWLDVKFPDSAEWEKSEWRVWRDETFNCVFTLPKKDVELMFPPEKFTWHENDHEKLTQWSSKEWLKGKKLDHFKVLEYQSKTVSLCHVTVVVDNPTGFDDNQRVWVYINCFDM